MPVLPGPNALVGHNTVLFSFGPVNFRVVSTVGPKTEFLNVHEYSHVTSSDYARKLVIGANPQREYMGEGDEEILLSGMVFPRARGGFGALEVLEANRRNATSQTLIRGGSSGGAMLGWFVCEHLERRHTNLWLDGIGQVISWQGLFSRTDQPDPSNYYYALSQVMGP